jgi:tryptophanyl-tRNA synthetase
MSSSDSNSSILLTDTPEQIRYKITHYAFSGLQPDGTVNLDIDVPYQYLRFFYEDDDKLEEIARKYSTGEMKVEEVKEVLIDCLVDFT